jgi:hypothetical protein
MITDQTPKKIKNTKNNEGIQTQTRQRKNQTKPDFK